MNKTMRLRIAHLYADLMNIYGDWGNIVAISYRAKQRGIAVEVSPVSLGDELMAEQYDLYFFGGGQDVGQEIVAPDLMRIAPILKEEVETGAALLSICGGYQLLGKEYHTAAGEVLSGADILPISTEAGEQRMMNNLVVATNPKLDVDRSEAATLVGFENHSGRTSLLDGALPLGRVVKGNGNNGRDGTEGVVYKSAIGTYLHGSCLPKNPHLADWLLKRALYRRYGEVELAPLDDELEWQAHRLAAGLKP
jgi:lipid II isoglutaminyl synthase (glutamine-hydrolysing)